MSAPDASPPGLPRSALLACWTNAVTVGLSTPEQLVDVVRGGDAAHLVTGLDTDGLELPAALDVLASRGLRWARLVLPEPGNPAGGATAFGAAALESGEAVLVTPDPDGREHGVGLVPVAETRVVRWWALPAQVPPDPEGPAAAGAWLRQELVTATHRLVELDVASWQPDIPDLLTNLRHRPALPLPPGFDPRLAATLDRAALCREIVALALTDEGGALTSSEVLQRRGVLRDLGAAARTALECCCGPLAFDMT